MKILFASHNTHKSNEIRQMLPNHFKLNTLADLHWTSDIPETGTTLAENAIIKTNFAAQQFNLPCFSDDTGLEVDALGGAPGVYSGRYAGEPKNDAKNIEKLLDALGETSHRSARFKTVIALWFGNTMHLFEGSVEGRIATTPVGTHGFGYDSVFIPEGQTRTFAEFSTHEKARLSHRGRALTQLIAFLQKQSLDTQC